MDSLSRKKVPSSISMEIRQRNQFFPVDDHQRIILAPSCSGHRLRRDVCDLSLPQERRPPEETGADRINTRSKERGKEGRNISEERDRCRTAHGTQTNAGKRSSQLREERGSETCSRTCKSRRSASTCVAQERIGEI